MARDRSRLGGSLLFYPLSLSCAGHCSCLERRLQACMSTFVFAFVRVFLLALVFIRHYFFNFSAAECVRGCACVAMVYMQPKAIWDVIDHAKDQRGGER